MRSVLQRVSRATVSVDDRVVGQIGLGLVVLTGVAAGDGPTDIEYTASKICEVRIFGDEQDRMNRSVGEVGGSLLVISQFTLLGDVRKGRRPSFDAAEHPDTAARTYADLLRRLRATGLPVEAGQFRADMKVDLVNDGPVTILLDSRRTF